MKLLRTFTLVAALAVTASAGGIAHAGDAKPAPAQTKKDAAKPAPPAPKKELSAAETEKFIAFFNKFVDVIVATKDDCTKMAAGINSLIDANQDLIKRANVAKAEGKDLPQAAKDKMMARVKEMMPAMQKCGADPKVQTAMKRMEDNKTSAPAKAKAAPKK